MTEPQTALTDEQTQRAQALVLSRQVLQTQSAGAVFTGGSSSLPKYLTTADLIMVAEWILEGPHYAEERPVILGSWTEAFLRGQEPQESPKSDEDAPEAPEPESEPERGAEPPDESAWVSPFGKRVLKLMEDAVAEDEPQGVDAFVVNSSDLGDDWTARSHQRRRQVQDSPQGGDLPPDIAFMEQLGAATELDAVSDEPEHNDQADAEAEGEDQ